MGPAGDGVVAVLTVITIWWLATHGKGNVAARLAVWGAAFIVVWVIIAVNNPHAGAAITSVYTIGAPAAVHGFASFLSHF